MKQSYFVLNKLLDNKFRLVHHVLYIFLIFLFWFLFVLNGARVMSLESVVKVILYSCTYVTIAYFNIYFLFQRYLLSGRLTLYILLSAATFVLSYVTQQLIYFSTWEDFWKQLTPSVALLADMTINAITYYMFIGIGLSIKMIKMWMNSEQRVISLEEENLKAKLSNLKSQLSPHFLFNTFNNLYVLTKTNPGVASEMILGFSDLMRYQLNESEKEKVDLVNEVEYIENFLALEKLRKDNLEVKVKFDKQSLEGIKIEPLLFVTLVENAVKHGSQQMEKPFIHIWMEIREHSLYFEVVNSKPEISLLGKEESLGKGIDNMKKRLNLCYPSKHSLELINHQNVFTAKLGLVIK